MRTCLPAPYLETLYYSQTQHTPTTTSFPRSPHSFPPSVRLLLTAPLHSTDYLGPISLFSLFAITSSHSPFIHSYSLARSPRRCTARARAIRDINVCPSGGPDPTHSLNHSTSARPYFRIPRLRALESSEIDESSGSETPPKTRSISLAQLE